MNVQDNLIDVAVDRSHEAKKDEIARDLAADLAKGIVRVTYETGIDEVDKTCSSRNNCAPIRGGLNVDDLCTSGFVMRNSEWGGLAPDERVMTTAAHCETSPSFHNDIRIGRSVWSENTDGADARILRIDNVLQAQPTNMIYRSGNHGTRITTKISTPNSSLHGTRLCSEGFMGGSRCGDLDSYNGTFQGRPGFGIIDNTACPGDSGAPVVNAATNRAYGIITGGPTGCAGPNAFTWISKIESFSGYRLLMTNATEALNRDQGLRGETVATPDQRIVSEDGRFQAVMQSDGNFVIYQNSGSR